MSPQVLFVCPNGSVYVISELEVGWFINEFYWVNVVQILLNVSPFGWVGLVKMVIFSE